MGLKVCLDGLKKDDDEKVTVEAETITRDDEPTVRATPEEEIPDVVPLDAGIQMTPKTHEEVAEEIATLCDDFQRAWHAEKRAKADKDAAKKKLLKAMEKRDVVDWETDAGTFKVSVVKDSIGLIAEKVKAILTAEQIKSCTGVTRKGYTGINFKPAKKGG